jgi:hypothetical protein
VSEPQRIEQQILPDALRIVSAEEARTQEAALAAAAQRPAECLVAGPVDEIGGQMLRQALQAWPAGSWSLEPVVEPARWIIYLGRYAAPEDVERKRVELRQIGVAYEPLTEPALEPGLSLGAFATQSAASQRLERLGERGVRTARVVQERPEVRGQLLRLPAVDDNLRIRLDDVRPALAGNPLRPCRPS